MKGVENTRRFLLEWISFLHRYIPVGILECPPQKINDRPPVFKGRDELETLMASPNCAHWIELRYIILSIEREKNEIYCAFTVFTMFTLFTVKCFLARFLKASISFQSTRQILGNDEVSL